MWKNWGGEVREGAGEVNRGVIMKGLAWHAKQFGLDG